MKSILILFLISIRAFLAEAQDKRIDVSPGLFDIQIGQSFEPVRKLFGMVTERDVTSGQDYFVMLNPEETEYSEVLGVKIQKLEVYVENGLIEEIIVVYPKKAKLSVVTDNAIELYGGAPCMLAVKNHEEGGCYWDGNKYSLKVTTEDAPFLMAKFSRMTK